MWERNLEFVTGLMVGIEFPPSREIHEDMAFALVIDLFILRLTFVKWDSDS